MPIGCSCVNFDPDADFDLAPYLSDFAAERHVPVHGSSTCYRLYAVSNHMGSLGGGHYTAYAKVEEQWCVPVDQLVPYKGIRKPTMAFLTGCLQFPALVRQVLL